MVSGPVTIAEYMREVLTNPIHGFYMENTVLGSEGHFITSPEIRLIRFDAKNDFCLIFLYL